MAGNNVINYDIKFNADTSNITSQVNQLKTSFQELKSIAQQKLTADGVTDKQRQEYQQLLQTINAVDTAMTQAFNKDLGTLNVAKFNQSINSSVGGIQNVGNALNGMGTKGQQAFKKLATELLTVNHQLRQSGGFLASMAQTMANTIKWGVASSVMNNFTGTVKKAYGYVKHLDSSLNDIRIVTGKSSDEMDKFAVKANKAAQSLGQSTTAYTEAALIYYQQGLGDVDVEARANVTLKAANVTGQTGEEVSEQLTAVWNGYKVSAEESELYIDKLAAVAANSASNLEELSTGMSKVASAANAMGVDVDQLNAQLSTIISVTRQAPESVGTALKTIYARMSDLKLGKTDEDGLGLGDVSGTMESMGIDVMDATGNLRDMGDVIEDVAKKWGTWTEAQQTAMAQAMAGKRQYNNLVALFENWDMYERSKDVSEGSAGTLQKQQDTYMESTAAHLKQLKAEWEDLYDSLMDPKQINGVVDGLTKVVNLMGAWVDGIGGGVNMFAMLGSVAMNVFSRQIATGLTNTILKFQTSKQMAADMRAEMELTKQIDTTKSNSSDLRVLVDMKKQQLAVTQAMTQQEYELVNKMIEEKSLLQDQAAELNNKYNQAKEYYGNTSAGKDNPLTKENVQDAGRNLIADGNVISVQSNNILKEVDSVDKLTVAYMKLGQAQAANDKKGIREAQKEITKTFNTTQAAVKKATNEMQGWLESGKVQGEEATKLKGILADLSEEQLKGAQSSGEVAKKLTEGAKIGQKAGVTLKQYGQTLQKTEEELKANANAMDRLNQKWNMFFQELNLRAQIQNFTTMISKVGQLASAVNMGVNIHSIFNDESLNAGEKFLRITMSLTTMVPMAINGIMGLGTAYNALTTSLKGAIAMSEMRNALQAIENSQTATEIGLKYTLTAAEIDQLGIESNMNKQEMFERIIQATGLKLTDEEIKNLTTLSLLNSLEAATSEAGIKEDEKAIAIKFLKNMKDKEENVNLATKIWLKTKEIALYVLGNPLLLAAVAATSLLVTATWLHLSAEREKEKRLKKANEAVQKSLQLTSELTTKYSELESQIKSLKDTMADYNEGVTALKQLDTATDEYKEKLKEVNSEAENLLETLNLWDSYSYENGIIKIDQTALDSAIMAKELEAQEVKRQSYLAKMGSNVATANKERTVAALAFDEVGYYINKGLDKTDADYILSSAEYNVRKHLQDFGLKETDDGISNGVSVIAKYQDDGANDLESNYQYKVGNFTDQQMEQLAKAQEQYIESLKEEGEKFDASGVADGFANWVEKQGEALTGEDGLLAGFNEENLYFLKNGYNEEVVHALDDYNESIKQATEANKHYAQEVMKIVATQLYSDEIIAAATDENGNFDAALAETLSQAVGGFTANAVDEAGNNIAEKTGNAFADYQAAIPNVITNNDDANGIEIMLERWASNYGMNLNDLAISTFGSGYTNSNKTIDMAKQLAEKNGWEGATFDDKKGEIEIQWVDEKGNPQTQTLQNAQIQQQYANLILDTLMKQVQEQELQAVYGEDSINKLIEATKDTSASQFGASAEQMRQVAIDSWNTEGDALNLSSIVSTISQSEYEDLMKINDDEEMRKRLGYTKEMVEALGYKNGKGLAEGMHKGLEEHWSLEDAYAAADSQGETLAEKYELDMEVFKRYRNTIKETNKELSPDQVNEYAIANMRMEKGVKDLSSSWKDHKKVLEDTKSTAFELAQAQAAIEPHLKNILNLTDEEFDLLPENFAKDNVKEINDVMNGVEGSVQTLRAKMQDAWGEGYVLNINPELKDSELFGEIQSLQDKILEYNPNFEVGVSLSKKDQDDLYKAFDAIIANAGMTADQATEYFKKLGYDVVVKTEEKTVTDYIEYPIEDENGGYFANKAGGGPNYPNLKSVKLPLTRKITAVSTQVITPNGSYGGGVGFSSTPSSSSTSDKGGGGDDKPEKIDAFENEIDRYHDVENELKKLNKLLERQERIASKLTGKDRIAAIQKQISLLQEQNEKQKEKLKLMQEEAAELKKKLQGEGVKFDAEGDISNYKALLQAKEDEINKMIDEANSKSSKDAQEKIKEDIENAKEEYEKLKEWIERYETLMYDEMPGLEDEMQEAWDKQIELQIEAFEIEIQLKLDLQDTKRQLNEFMREVIEGIEDDEYGKIQEYIAKDLPTYFGETGTAQANYDALQKALEEYQTIKDGGVGAIFGDDANAAWEKVMELKDETLDSLSEVKDLMDQMEENYLSAIEAASEEFAKHLEQYEHLQSILDHNIKLIEMLAGDEAYDAQLAYYNQMERKNLGQVDMARRDLEFWRQQKAAAEAGSKAWEEANAKEQEAQEQLNALVEQSVEIIKTKYEKTVSKIIKDLNNAVTNGKGLDALSQEWELINKEADMYLDTVNSAYEVQKLENKMIDAIDNASSLKAKQRLNELMEKELGMLKDKDKLSQYEVDRANQLLDIEMKKIALEEAQRNKSTMRLRRDAQGNYSYQYVTDNDAVAKAQEELNEAQNSLFNLDKDAYKENLDQILSLWTDFQTKLNEIWTNNNLTDEQKQQQAYELRERYMRMISGLTQDNENIRLNLETSTFSELARLRNMDVQDFQNMADEQKKILLEQVIPQWSSGLQSLADQFKDENGFTSLMNQAFNDLQTNLANYQKSLKDLEKNAGINFDKIISGAEDYSKEIQNLINQNKTIVDDQAEILKGIRDSIDATKEWVEEFNKLAEAAKETLDTIVQIQEEENKKDTSNANNNSQNNKSEDKKDSSSNKDSSSSSSKSSSGGDGKLTTGETVTYVGGPYYETSAGGGKSGSRGPGKKVTVTRISKGEKYPIHVESGDSAFGWLKEDQLTGYGTGGYTGDWSSRDGRLAVLHEKELVLNKQDTQNILAAVDMVRSLNNSLTSRIANLFNHSSVDKLIQLFEKDSAPLEQNVQITASFPNVSVEHEIEEAFNSLISSASQYAFNTLK